MTATAPLFFGLPAQMNNSLEALYVDDTVYSVHWQKFMRTMIDSWKDSRMMVKEIEQLEGGLRFQLAAIVYSTPKAFVHWSLVLLAFEILSVIFEVSTSWGTLIMVALFSVVLSTVLVTLMVRKGMRTWHEYRSRKSEHSQV
ncbi:hypothetical protein EIP86_002906 [Pleurotus ostreatoroseus]|nr:hypothetical protein EIP86_002906 [Pleurotus ostreatoroseus]